MIVWTPGSGCTCNRALYSYRKPTDFLLCLRLFDLGFFSLVIQRILTLALGPRTWLHVILKVRQDTFHALSSTGLFAWAVMIATTPLSS